LTFTSINPATAVISGGAISASAFGDLVCSNFDDHQTRIVANESDIRTASNALTVIRDTAGRRYHAATTQLISNSAAWVAHPFDTANGTETGYTYSSGIFTIAATGYYDIKVCLCGLIGSDTGYYIQSCLAINSAGAPGTNEKWDNDAQGVGTSSQVVLSRLFAKRVPITAGQGFSVFIRANIAGTLKTYAPTNMPSPGSETIAQAKPTNISVARVA